MASIPARNQPPTLANKIDRAADAPKLSTGAGLRVIDGLDMRRKALGLPFSQWARETGISDESIRLLLRGKRNGRPDTLARLRRALDRLANDRHGPAHKLPREITRVVFSGYLLAVCRAMGLPEAIAHAIDPATSPRGAAADAMTREAHAARAVALYLANVQTGISQADLAAMLGIDRAAVSRAIRLQEDGRENADIEALVQQASRAMQQGEVM
jgi:transcriptional regulator with XRE-family HTH domain